MAQQVCFDIGTNYNQLHIKAPSLSLFFQYLSFDLSVNNMLFFSFDYAGIRADKVLFAGSHAFLLAFKEISNRMSSFACGGIW